MESVEYDFSYGTDLYAVKFFANKKVKLFINDIEKENDVLEIVAILSEIKQRLKETKSDNTNWEQVVDALNKFVSTGIFAQAQKQKKEKSTLVN